MELDSCSGRPSQQHLCLAMSSLVSRILKNVKMIGDFSWKLTYISHLTPSVRGLKPHVHPRCPRRKPFPLTDSSHEVSQPGTWSKFNHWIRYLWYLQTQLEAEDSDLGSPVILFAPHVDKKWRSLKSMNPCNPKDATYYMYIIIL